MGETVPLMSLSHPPVRPDALNGGPLRIGILVYRGNPYCGGQGVYTKAVAVELAKLGHHVEVFSGPPYPHIDEATDGVALHQISSMDLYPSGNPFRVPWPWEFRDLVDVGEFGIMSAAGYPEPWAFSKRIRKVLASRRGDFDLIHDNQCLGTGLQQMIQVDHWPMVATLHHPITVDRDLDMAHTTDPWRKFTLSRWYGFLKMQMRVAKSFERIVTVSENSKNDIVAQMGVDRERLHVVPVGVDQDVFRPLPEVARVPGRVVCTTSSDVPMKGFVPLLEALAKVRTDHPNVHLVCIGKLKDGSQIPAVLDRLGLKDVVSFVHGVATERIVELYAEASLAVVPSLYEGFSLPAVEAMACGAPLIATTGGALPEVVGTDGSAGVLVPPNDPEALANAIRTALDDQSLRDRIGPAGRARILNRFTWKACAEGTADQYRAYLETRARQERDGVLS